MSSNCIGWSIFDDDNLVAYGKLKPDKSCNGYDEKISNLIPQLHDIMKQYMPEKCYAEDVPIMNKGGTKTAIILGAVHGALLGICLSHNVPIEFIRVGQWRSAIGILHKEKSRDRLKELSIQKANELFNLNLAYVSPSSSKNDDDVSDSVLIYCSTRQKYRVQ